MAKGVISGAGDVRMIRQADIASHSPLWPRAGDGRTGALRPRAIDGRVRSVVFGGATGENSPLPVVRLEESQFLLKTPAKNEARICNSDRAKRDGSRAMERFGGRELRHLA